MRTLVVLLLALSLRADAAKTLDIYFVDVEGGQATLIVSPSGESMLVDTGWPGFNGRDADRIAAAAKKAGVKKIDYLFITHHHGDHVGGVKQLIERIPVKNFLDHGDTVETNKNALELKEMYTQAAASGKRINVKPGDTIPVKGLNIQVVAARAKQIQKALPGGGTANGICGASQYPEDKSENGHSAGFLLTHGKFRFADLGDLTLAKEAELVCPENLLGTVDVYLTTHHGLQTSNAKEIVYALKPRVAIMNNGAKKGGSPEAVQIIRSSPGLEDMWQVHYAIAGGKENNVAEPMIANLVENCEGHYVKLSAMNDGSFTLYNDRNKYEKKYAKR